MAHIVVVGAGMGGLAAAIRLRLAGHTVAVYEANAYVGGKLSVLQVGAYRFDAGPSLFTQPDYHAELFRLAGKNPANYFAYKRLDTVCHYFWPDGSSLQAPADPTALAKALATTFGEDRAAVEAYLARGRKKFALAGDIFLNNPLQRLGTFTSAKAARAIAQIYKLQIFRSLHGLHRATFRHPHTVQLFDRYATYNGSDPYQASALYSMIPSFEHGEGAYFPTEGMASIGQSLYRLAEELGVAFHFNCPVLAIERAGNRVKGIRTAAGPMAADAVVSNADVTHLYRDLMPAAPAPERALAQPLSTSAVVFYWGVRRSFGQLGLHNIFFSGDYKAEFEALFQSRRWPADPTVYVNISSKYKPDDAPAGAENWFVMVNVPARTDLDTPEAVAALRQTVLRILSARLGVEIEPLIEAETLLTPSSIQRRTSGWQGALYGSNSNSLWSGFWRHPNFSARYKGLFFTGGTVHPGGGIPLALKSGQIAARLAQAYLQK